ncbi:GNAT family N-acetyltransferase [Carnobacterium sp.]|uniref:GNAT family N-acetyltransferase n=1 Tax=Carnobacterium sp. TaxID=48221 RepID=UPI00388EB378
MIKQIEKVSNEELDTLIELWLNVNIEAHDYINKDYWISNKEFVKSELPKATILAYYKEKEIVGFLGFMDNYIAGIFIQKGFRGCGIGKKLLDIAKEKSEQLTLTVYKKNRNAIGFYSAQKFKKVKEVVDTNTSEIEYIMVWQK